MHIWDIYSNTSYGSEHKIFFGRPWGNLKILDSHPQSMYQGLHINKGIKKIWTEKTVFSNVSPQIENHSTDADLPIRMAPYSPGMHVCARAQLLHHI